MESRPYLRQAVEITIRLLAIVFGSVPSLIAAIVAVGTFQTVPVRLGDIDDRDEISIDEVSEEEDRPAVQLRDSIYTATGLMIGVALLAIILQIVLIIQFLHLGRNNFLVCDIVISFTLAAGHNVGRVFLNIAASQLKWLILSVEFVNKDDPEKIRNALTASAGFSSNGTFLFIILAVFLMFVLFKDRKEKEAVTPATQ